jgi:type II secretory pathway pseudopilin PulG
MEGKKIVFIVVAIATVGGIAYYLNKKNKANVLTNKNLAMQDYLAKQDKSRQDFAEGEKTRIDLTAKRVNVLENVPQKRGSKTSTRYFKIEE